MWDTHSLTVTNLDSIFFLFLFGGFSRFPFDLALVPPIVRQMDCLEQISLRHLCFAETSELGRPAEMFGQEQIKAGAVKVGGVVQNVQVGQLGAQFEYFVGSFQVFDLVRPQIQIGQLGQFRLLLLNDLVDFVAAEVQFFKGRERFPAWKGADIVGCEVQFFTFGQIFENRQSFEFVVYSDEGANFRMPLPSLVNFLKLVAADVQIL